MLSINIDPYVCTMLRLSKFPVNKVRNADRQYSHILGYTGDYGTNRSEMSLDDMVALMRKSFAKATYSDYGYSVEDYGRLGAVFAATSQIQSYCEPALEKLGFNLVGKFKSKKYSETSEMSYWLMPVPDFFEAIGATSTKDLEKEINALRK